VKNLKEGDGDGEGGTSRAQWTLLVTHRPGIPLKLLQDRG